jgi:hypothetical protein
MPNPAELRELIRRGGTRAVRNRYAEDPIQETQAEGRVDREVGQEGVWRGAYGNAPVDTDTEPTPEAPAIEERPTLRNNFYSDWYDSSTWVAEPLTDEDTSEDPF